MQRSDLIKIVVAVIVVVCAGTLFFLRSEHDDQDYITAPKTVQKATAPDKTTDRSRRGKKKKPAPPMTRVGEDIG